MRNICCQILKIGNSVGYPKTVTLPADNQSVNMRLVPSSNRDSRQSHDGTEKNNVRGVMRTMLGIVASRSSWQAKPI